MTSICSRRVASKLASAAVTMKAVSIFVARICSVPLRPAICGRAGCAAEGWPESLPSPPSERVDGDPITDLGSFALDPRASWMHLR